MQSSFAETILLNSMNDDGWYGALKETIREEQKKLVWVSDEKVRLHMASICLYGKTKDQHHATITSSQYLKHTDYHLFNGTMHIHVHNTMQYKNRN